MVIFFVQLGGNVRVAMRDHSRRIISTDLFMAASLGKASTASFLIDQGVDVEESVSLYVRSSQYRASTLHAAARGNHFTDVELLLDQGAFLNPTYHTSTYKHLKSITRGRGNILLH